MAADANRLAAALAYEDERKRRLAETIPTLTGLTTAPRRSVRTDLENLSAGLGQGIVNQLEGVKGLIADPVGTAKGAYEAVRGIVRDPKVLAQALAETGRKAMSGPLGAGEVVGEFLTPSVKGVGKRDIFIGKSARTWDAAAAKRAEEMEAAGVVPEEIWRETGTFRAPDGQLRQEISDESAYLRQEPDFDAAIQAKKAEIAAINQRVRDLKEGVKTQPDLFPREFNRGVRELAATKKPLQQDIKGNFGLEYGKTGYLGSRARLAVEHPALFEAYPELGQKLIVRRNQPLGDSTRGQYSPTDNRVDIGSTLSNNPSAASSTALHELQHAIQETEGFARGGSATQFQPTALGAKAAEVKTELSKALTGGTSSSTREIIDNFDYLPADTATQIAKKFGFNDPNDLRNFIILESNKTTPFEQYRRLAGEAEARAVQGRKVLDQEQRRRVFPLQSYDVPINELIIRR
jgi:hypothetical protein